MLQFLRCVYYWQKLLRWMFFIPFDNWKILFLKKVYCYPDIFLNSHILVFFWNKCFNFILKKAQNLSGSIIFTVSDNRCFTMIFYLSDNRCLQWYFMFLQRVKWGKIIEHVSLISIVVIQMVALNSEQRTNRKQRKHRKTTKTSFLKE